MAATAMLKNYPTWKNEWLQLILEKKLARLEKEWPVASPFFK